jgi:6-methylsalicylate decarboxylase
VNCQLRQRDFRLMPKDTTFNPVAMGALRQVVPVSQIVFGTDFPFRTTSEHVKGLAASQTFSPDELRAIYRENAVRLLPQRAG